MLVDCPNIWGYSTVLTRDPRVEIHEDVLFVPGGSGGLFDRGRRLIAGSGYYRGLPSALGALDLVHGSIFSGVNPDDITDFIEETVVFGGVLIGHFGHFLLGTLARWWNSEHRGDFKHVVINQGSIQDILDLPFYQVILNALGFSPSSFLTFNSPQRLAKAIVVYPSFEENNLAHLAFARLCNDIVSRLDLPMPIKSEPIFLSKSRVRNGITHVENEGELCSKLETYGVKIVYPETLSLADQISTFRSSPAISGFMGSAFHLSAFAPQCNLMAINHSPDIISNQVMIDRIQRNHARYVFSGETFTALGPNENFHRTFLLNNVDQTCSEIMRYFDKTVSSTSINC